MSASPTGIELRTLARQIDTVLLDSPCMSVALDIVGHCTNHLRLLAAHHDANLREANRESVQLQSGGSEPGAEALGQTAVVGSTGA